PMISRIVPFSAVPNSSPSRGTAAVPLLMGTCTCGGNLGGGPTRRQARAGAPIRRRQPGPAAESPRETAACGESEQVGDVAQGMPRRAQVGECQRMARVIENILVGGAALAEFAL